MSFVFEIRTNGRIKREGRRVVDTSGFVPKPQQRPVIVRAQGSIPVADEETPIVDGTRAKRVVYQTRCGGSNRGPNGKRHR